MHEKITLDSLRRSGSKKWTTYPDALGMFLAEMDFGIPPVVRDIVAHAATNGCLGYLPETVRGDLQNATASMLARRYHWTVNPDQVYVLPDVLSALKETIRYLSSGPVVVPTPAYMPFLTLPAELGREIIQVPSPIVDGRYVLDLVGIDRALRHGGLLILCNPWNPVGRVLTREELLALEQIVTKNGAKVFSDEIHAPLVFDGEHIPYASISTQAASHTITALAASKGWNIPGLKCAQMILNTQDQETIEPYVFAMSDPVGILGPKAAIAVYTDDGGWCQDISSILKTNRTMVCQAISRIPELEATCPEGTYISWIDAKKLAERVGSPTRHILNHGVALTDGTMSGRGYENHMRLIFATPSDILETALDRIAKAASYN